MRVALAVLVCVLVLASCGGEETESAVAWKKTGDDAFVKRGWHEAYEAYRKAYALEDPVEARRAHRAFLAFRIGYCLRLAAVEYAASDDASERRADFMYGDALLWLAEALALNESEYWVWQQRGLIFDRGGPSGDRVLAREAYETFLRIHDEHTAPPIPPAEELADVRAVRERLRALR